eukprot:4583115-Prymnesium_polylepis.1
MPLDQRTRNQACELTPTRRVDLESGWTTLTRASVFTCTCRRQTSSVQTLPRAKPPAGLCVICATGPRVADDLEVAVVGGAGGEVIEDSGVADSDGAAGRPDGRCADAHTTPVGGVKMRLARGSKRHGGRPLALALRGCATAFGTLALSIPVLMR